MSKKNLQCQDSLIANSNTVSSIQSTSKISTNSVLPVIEHVNKINKKEKEYNQILTTTTVPIGTELITVQYVNPFQLSQNEINNYVEHFTHKSDVDGRFHCQWQDCDDNSGKGWKAKGKLKPHIEADHLFLRIMCPICKQEIKSRKDNLREHIDKSHVGHFQSYKCPEFLENGQPCTRKAKRLSDLRRHLSDTNLHNRKLNTQEIDEICKKLKPRKLKINELVDLKNNSSTSNTNNTSYSSRITNSKMTKKIVSVNDINNVNDTGNVFNHNTQPKNSSQQLDQVTHNTLKNVSHENLASKIDSSDFPSSEMTSGNRIDLPVHSAIRKTRHTSTLAIPSEQTPISIRKKYNSTSNITSGSKNLDLNENFSNTLQKTTTTKNAFSKISSQHNLTQHHSTSNIKSDYLETTLSDSELKMTNSMFKGNIASIQSPLTTLPTSSLQLMSYKQNQQTTNYQNDDSPSKDITETMNIPTLDSNFNNLKNQNRYISIQNIYNDSNNIIVRQNNNNPHQIILLPQNGDHKNIQIISTTCDTNLIHASDTNMPNYHKVINLNTNNKSMNQKRNPQLPQKIYSIKKSLTSTHEQRFKQDVRDMLLNLPIGQIYPNNNVLMKLPANHIITSKNYILKKSNDQLILQKNVHQAQNGVPQNTGSSESNGDHDDEIDRTYEDVKNERCLNFLDDQTNLEQDNRDINDEYKYFEDMSKTHPIFTYPEEEERAIELDLGLEFFNITRSLEICLH